MTMDIKKVSILLILGGMALTVILGIGAYEDTKLEKGYQIQRNAPGKGSEKEKLIAEIEGTGEIFLEIEIPEQKLLEQEALAELEEAAASLEDLIKGKNPDLAHVTEELNLITRIPDSNITVEWQMDSWEFFYGDYKMKENIYLKEPKEILLKAVLTCQGWSRLAELPVTLLPRDYSVEEQFKQEVAQCLEETKEQTIFLPRSFQGKDILWKRKLDTGFLMIPVLSVIGTGALFLGQRQDRRREKKRRKELLESDYAEIVSKFLMLFLAGFSVRNAWERIVWIHKKSTYEIKKKPVYEELEKSLLQFQQGVPDLRIMEEFAERIGEIHYKKFISLLIINQKRGNSNLVQALELEMSEAWNEKKRGIRRNCEKIAAKLMLPMMGMLSVVFLMILVPAFMSFYQ